MAGTSHYLPLPQDKKGLESGDSVEKRDCYMHLPPYNVTPPVILLCSKRVGVNRLACCSAAAQKLVAGE